MAATIIVMLKLVCRFSGSRSGSWLIMKICAYCTTENRDEAIFCTRCKRPLQAKPTRKDHSSRNAFLLLCLGLGLLGLTSYFLSSYSFLAPSITQTPTTIPNWTPGSGLVPTRTPEPITISACVRDTTRIRRSPSTHAETIGGLLSGTCLTILGRNAEATWVYIVSEDYQTGWMSASLVSDTRTLNKVSVRDDSGWANSSRPTLTSAEIAHGAQAYLTHVAATTLPQSPLTQYMVPCFETANRIGDHISCRLERAYCEYLPTSEGNRTFCHDRPVPDHSFALTVLGEDWSDFDGQCLIVSGYLEIAGGVLQIEAFRRSQISFCN